ncbi:heme ABC transporter substrate-binding protein IsdE [Amedibacillus sp. YH-ame10]
MLKKLRSSLLCGASLLLLCGCVSQNQKSISSEKIVVTSVSIAEILNALEVDTKQIVGVPSSDTYELPKAYQNIKTIGTPMSPDMEIIAQLSPSLILSPNSLEDDLAKKYEKAGFRSSFLNMKSVTGMYKSIEELGTLLDKESQAKKLVNEFVTYMKEYKATNQEKTQPKVLILMGLPGSYVVATSSSYVGDLVKLAGGENVYGDGDGKDFLNVNPEDMLKKQPDMILRTSHAMPDQVKEMFAKEFSENDIWSQFDAVQKNKVYDLHHENFGMSANFNYQTALKELEGILYGDD